MKSTLVTLIVFLSVILGVFVLVEPFVTFLLGDRQASSDARCKYQYHFLLTNYIIKVGTHFISDMRFVRLHGEK